MIQNLLNQGVEVLQASAPFSQDSRSYGAGTYVVSMAQPKMGVVRWMLGRTWYLDNEYTLDNDGNPIRPYDMATDVMAEFMGVRVDPTNTVVSATLSRVMSAEPPAGKVASGAASLAFSGRLNDSWRAANMLMARAPRCGAWTRGRFTSATTSCAARRPTCSRRSRRRRASTSSRPGNTNTVSHGSAPAPRGDVPALQRWQHG
jgi:hypothetical protein